MEEWIEISFPYHTKLYRRRDDAHRLIAIVTAENKEIPDTERPYERGTGVYESRDGGAQFVQLMSKVWGVLSTSSGSLVLQVIHPVLDEERVCYLERFYEKDGGTLLQRDDVLYVQVPLDEISPSVEVRPLTTADRLNYGGNEP